MIRVLRVAELAVATLALACVASPADAAFITFNVSGSSMTAWRTLLLFQSQMNQRPSQ